MGEKMIEITDLSIKFSELNLFSGLNLSVNKDEIIAIIGPSGCGKTTLLRMICGLEKDYSGNIRFESKDISEISVEDKIGFIFQNQSYFLT